MMDYTSLLDLAMKLGYRLAMSGAETFRVEDSVSRIMRAYGVSAEVFAIPNLLIINIETPDGQTYTRMRRIGYHGNDLNAVEQYNSVSRKICSEIPAPDVAIEWVRKAEATNQKYSLPIFLAGNFLGACGFAIFFGGNLIDSVCAGFCGILVGLINRAMDSLKVNPFFSTIAAAFVSAFTAYCLGVLQISSHPDTVIIGTFMILVPGLLFTNAMRDIIFGDTNSGINRIVQVLLIALAIAMGTGAAWSLVNAIFGVPVHFAAPAQAAWIQCVASFIGCIGFAILFNIHGPGCLLCALGGVLAWAVYSVAFYFGENEVLGYLLAAIVASGYSETMARVRKYPAISYLVVSIFPLLPGAGIYYTTNYLFLGEMVSFTETGIQTVAIAGALAVGILVASTTVRLHSIWKTNKKTC